MAERSFTIYQLADLLGVTPAEVRSWIDKGWLRCHKLDDRTYRISETQLVRFLKAQGIDIELILAKTVSSEEGHDEKTPEVEVPCVATLASDESPRRLLAAARNNSETVLTGEMSDVSLREASTPRPDRLASEFNEELLRKQPAESEEIQNASEPVGVPCDTPKTDDSNTHADQEDTHLPPADLKVSSTKPEPSGRAQQILDAVLDDAVRCRASGVRLHLRNDDLTLALRIGGMLNEKPGFRRRLPSGLGKEVIADLADRAGLADGKGIGEFKLRTNGGEVTCVASVCGTIDGSMVNIELLLPPAGGLETLGLGQEDLKTLRAVVSRSWGLMIVTAPPRSGARRFCDALMHELGGAGRSTISAVLDAAPSDVPRAKHEADPSSVAGAMEILAHQAHDAILTDILDPATANAAAGAASRGALVVARMTEASVCDALARLRDMGLDEWRLSSVVAGITSVRTVRLLCERCRKQTTGPGQDALPPELIGKGMEFPLFAPAGCKDCRGGYNQTALLASTFVTTPQTSSRLRQRHPTGLASLWTSANSLLKTGGTSLEEVLRVLKKVR